MRLVQEGRESERLTTLAIGAAFAFNYPLLYLLSEGGTLFGIPLLFVYLFLTWLIVIGLTAALMERSAASRAVNGSHRDETSTPDD